MTSNQDQSPALASADSIMPGALMFTVTRPLNIAQFESELSRATGVSVEDILPNVSGDAMAATTQASATLFLMPTTLDRAAVQKVIDDHVASPTWGWPQVLTDYDSIVSRLHSDPSLSASLTSDEVRTLVVGIALKLS